MEPCSGCGDVARHPMVGVTRDEETGEMEAFPVCRECWLNPEHRKTPLKMHFYAADQADIALERAGKGDIG